MFVFVNTIALFRILKILGHPDPSVRGTDPDPYIIKQNSKKNLDSIVEE
jgi:hypothetical protein